MRCFLRYFIVVWLASCLIEAQILSGLQFVNVYGKGKKKYMVASLPGTFHKTQRQNFKSFTVAGIKELVGYPISIKFHREGRAKRDVFWMNYEPQIFLHSASKELNYNLCLLDGDDDAPRAMVVDIPEAFRPGLIAIGSVQQGDRIIVEVCVEGRKYEDQIAVVKGFT